MKISNTPYINNANNETDPPEQPTLSDSRESQDASSSTAPPAHIYAQIAGAKHPIASTRHSSDSDNLKEATSATKSREYNFEDGKNLNNEGAINESIQDQPGRKPGGIHSETGGNKAEEAGLRNGGGIRGGLRVLDESSGADNRSTPLKGLPGKVKVNGNTVQFGPYQPARDAAIQYAKESGINYQPPTVYVKIDKDRAKRIAAAFEAMPHEPNDPATKASYAAMIKETLAQYQAVKKTGLKVELIASKDEHGELNDPYGNPRNAMLDIINNNHFWLLPTNELFGASETAHVNTSGNPLLEPTNEVINGQRLLANDIFRVVHDFFGHVKEGVGFRAEGEENAWQQHAAMYSDEALPAATTELRGQNSWVNFGPYAEFNKTANVTDTQYAPQKTGLLPDWAMTEGYAGGKRHDDASVA